MSARSFLEAARQPILLTVSAGVLFLAFFYAATYATFIMPNGSAALLGPEGYFAMLAFLSALAIGILFRVPFGMFFPKRTWIWALRCSIVAALAHIALAIDTFQSTTMPLWPFVDASVLVVVFSSIVGLGKRKENVSAI